MSSKFPYNIVYFNNLMTTATKYHINRLYFSLIPNSKSFVIGDYFFLLLLPISVHLSYFFSSASFFFIFIIAYLLSYAGLCHVVLFFCVLFPSIYNTSFGSRLVNGIAMKIFAGLSVFILINDKYHFSEQKCARPCAHIYTNIINEMKLELRMEWNVKHLTCCI